MKDKRTLNDWSFNHDTFTQIPFTGYKYFICLDWAWAAKVGSFLATDTDNCHMHISHRNGWAFRGLWSHHDRQQTAVCSSSVQFYNNMSTYRRHMMDVIFPVSSVGRGLNNSCQNVQHTGLVMGVALLLISVQLKRTKYNCTQTLMQTAMPN